MKFNADEWKDFSASYYKIITTDLAGLNLTALNSVDDIYTKQVLDTVEPVIQIKKLHNELAAANYIVDLGTGGGFPLLPLAKIYPDKMCVGIDARNKKLKAVEFIAEKIKLKNIALMHATFKEIIFDKPKIVFVVKAVGKTTDIIESLNLEYPADIFFYKGANFYQLEIEEIEKLKNNEQLVSIQEIAVEGLEKRYIVHCKLRENVPRGTKTMRNQKLFSSFV
jgi:16S rRNA (guanine527-N7)-methyltransferase